MKSKAAAIKEYADGQMTPALFAFFTWLYWECPPDGQMTTTVPHLARESPLSERTIYRYLAELERGGYIEREAQSGKGITVYVRKNKAHYAAQPRAIPLNACKRDLAVGRSVKRFGFPG